MSACRERYEQAGTAGLGRRGGWRSGRRRISGKRLRLIERLQGAGLSNRAIAQRPGVHEKPIKKLVGPSKGDETEQLTIVSAPKVPAIESQTIASVSISPIEPFVDPAPATPERIQEAAVLEEKAEEDEPVPRSLDPDASNRTLNRQLAHAALPLRADQACLLRTTHDTRDALSDDAAADPAYRPAQGA